MQICSNCGRENGDDLYYCEKCATLLDRGEATIPTVEPTFRQQLGRMVRQTTGLLRRREVMVHVETAPEPLPLPDAKQIILGRITTDDLENNAHLDFSAYGALDLGVSRAHATLYRLGNELTIMDMGSANGSYLNGQRLRLGQPYVIHNNDEIHLGNFAIRIAFE